MLDLTPARMRQIRSVILAEEAERHLVQVRLAERMTRELVGHLRAAAGDKKADKAANAVRFTNERNAGKPGPRELPSFERVSQLFGTPPPR